MGNTFDAKRPYAGMDDDMNASMGYLDDLSTQIAKRRAPRTLLGLRQAQPSMYGATDPKAMYYGGTGNALVTVSNGYPDQDVSEQPAGALAGITGTFAPSTGGAKPYRFTDPFGVRKSEPVQGFADGASFVNRVFGFGRADRQAAADAQTAAENRAREQASAAAAQAAAARMGVGNVQAPAVPAPVQTAPAQATPAQATPVSTLTGYAGGSALDRRMRAAGLRQGVSRVPGPQNVNHDVVPAVLTPGEAVLNKGAAQALGRGKIEALNQKHATGPTRLRKGVLHAEGGVGYVDEAGKFVKGLRPQFQFGGGAAAAQTARPSITSYAKELGRELMEPNKGEVGSTAKRMIKDAYGRPKVATGATGTALGKVAQIAAPVMSAYDQADDLGATMANPELDWLSKAGAGLEIAGNTAIGGLMGRMKALPGLAAWIGTGSVERPITNLFHNRLGMDTSLSRALDSNKRVYDPLGAEKEASTKRAVTPGVAAPGVAAPVAAPAAAPGALTPAMRDAERAATQQIAAGSRGLGANGAVQYVANNSGVQDTLNKNYENRGFATRIGETTGKDGKKQMMLSGSRPAGYTDGWENTPEYKAAQERLAGFKRANAASDLERAVNYNDRGGIAKAMATLQGAQGPTLDQQIKLAELTMRGQEHAQRMAGEANQQDHFKTEEMDKYLTTYATMPDGKVNAQRLTDLRAIAGNFAKKNPGLTGQQFWAELLPELEITGAFADATRYGTGKTPSRLDRTKQGLRARDKTVGDWWTYSNENNHMPLFGGQVYDDGLGGVVSTEHFTPEQRRIIEAREAQSRTGK